MLETLRKYWIALLLLLMIGIHASIVGIIRYQASLAKLDASCEVDLGNYLGYQRSRQAPMSMRIHALVPANHRLTSRHLLEANHFQIRQAIEERLRQVDPQIFSDPYLGDLKAQLFEVLVQMTGSSTVEEVLITDVIELKELGNLAFHAIESHQRSLPVVSSLRPPKNLEVSAGNSHTESTEEESTEHH